MKNIVLVSICISLFSIFVDTCLLAQGKPGSKPKQNARPTEKKIDSNSDEPKEAVIEDVVKADNPMPSEVEYGNNRYSHEQLIENWTLVRDRFSGEYMTGLAKNGKVILPIIFKTSYNLTTTLKEKKIILSIENNFGIYDLAQERWQIPLSYDNLSVLGGSLLIAKKGDKYGIIDFQGKIIIKFEWKWIQMIDEGNYVIVKNNQDLFGILNIVTAALVMPCNYKNIQKKDQSDVFLVTNGFGQKSLVTLNNQPILQNWYDEIHLISGRRNMVVKKTGKFGIIDDQEKEIVPIAYNMIRTYAYSDGSYLAQNTDGKFGCVNIDGKITLPFEYDKLSDASGESTILISEKEKKCGIVQINRGLPTEILTCDYDDIQINRRSFVISKAGKYGLLDDYGKIITPLEYDMITAVNDQNYSKNTQYIAQIGQRYLLLNSLGKKTSEKTYKSLKKLTDLTSESSYARNVIGIRFVTDNDKVGVLDMFGQELIPPTYEEIDAINTTFVIFKKDGYVGMYNYISKKEIAPPIYDRIILTKKGYIALKKNDLFLLDTTDATKHRRIN